VSLQEDHPVAFASRVLSDAEYRYAQVGKELLAIVYGMDRIHQYTYGRVVRVQTDHKPLEMIFCKPLQSTPRRLQRMLLRPQHYTLIVKYTSGKDVVVADALSRCYLPETGSPLEGTRNVLYVQSSFEVEMEQIKHFNF
jgi:hypothetical protein